MAEVTNDPEEAARLVAGGTPVVLVGPDALALGRFAASVTGTAGNGTAGKCLLAVLVGDLSDPAVSGAASQMAAELWPSAGTGPL
ncbi:MAG: hypothetical protein M0005_16155 [Actinomycetota bacterium]|nr:hypothetical protein [Actinomycetota bacterium]